MAGWPRAPPLPALSLIRLASSHTWFGGGYGRETSRPSSTRYRKGRVGCPVRVRHTARYPPAPPAAHHGEALQRDGVDGAQLVVHKHRRQQHRKAEDLGAVLLALVHGIDALTVHQQLGKHAPQACAGLRSLRTTQPHARTRRLRGHPSMRRATRRLAPQRTPARPGRPPTRLQGLPSASLMGMGTLHIHRPRVHECCVGDTLKPAEPAPPPVSLCISVLSRNDLPWRARPHTDSVARGPGTRWSSSTASGLAWRGGRGGHRRVGCGAFRTACSQSHPPPLFGQPNPPPTCGTTH